MNKPGTFHKFLSDLFMGPDGKTWAIGRVFSLLPLVVGHFVPIYMIARGQPVDLTQLGILLSGIAGAVLLLVRFNNDVDNPIPPHPASEEKPK